MTIEKDIPIPPKPKPQNGQTAPIYPWPQMEVGDSILVTQAVRSAISSASQYGHRQGKAFVSRTVGEGARIWRTA